MSQDRQQLEEARRDYQRAVTEHGADSAEAEKAKDALRATRRRLYERVRQDQRGADKSQSPDADDRRR